ncbi:Sec-independent protein translocase protein TatB [Thermomonas alba]|uniref:Sec-independent protein translocase protein TatB n=1 Tax=Thermomonas alba TaxID=2888525 RepID=UPI001F044FD6|nr:Sec-independent protein translocase protein TatB [Thermomonas alba]
MFDFSLGEMLVVALVALVVLGPERLPKAARLAGLWLRRARAHWVSVKNELEQELAREELARSLRETRQALDEAQLQLHTSGHDPGPAASASSPSEPAAPASETAANPTPAGEVRRDG